MNPRQSRNNIIIIDDIENDKPLRMKPCKFNFDKICDFPVYCENYKCDHQPIPCDHKDTSIVVLEVVVNCEKTALQCDYCGKILTKPKTDC